MSSGYAATSTSEGAGGSESGAPAYTMQTKPAWALTLDNDLFARGPGTDQDYTGGFVLTLDGSRADGHRFLLDRPLSWLHARFASRCDCLNHAPSGHSMQLGLTAFTPANIEASFSQPDDRPFANLVFISSSQLSLRKGGTQTFEDGLTAGIVGSGLGKSLQLLIHRAGGDALPTGYGYQISDGGELTARYEFRRQALALTRRHHGRTLEIKNSVATSVGFLTDVSGSLAMRFGRIASPWWSFAPSRDGYAPSLLTAAGEHAGAHAQRESYVWISATLRLRAYDVFLQGQFRDSVITFSRSNLNSVLGEISLGWRFAINDSLAVDQSFHYQSAAIRRGTGARDQLWGSLGITQRF